MTSTAKPIRIDFNMYNNQLLNLVFEKATGLRNGAPAGQPLFVDGVLYVYTGSEWINTCLKLATDAQAAAGTLETVAVNPKQLAVKANLASPALTGTPTTPTAAAGTNTTQIANTEFVLREIASAITNAIVYKGTWNTTSQTDYSNLNSYRPIKAGWYFKVTGNGCTIDGVEYKAGDSITFNTAVAAGVTITTAMIDKTDNTESDDLVRLDVIQVLTNKSIDADDNSISNLTLSCFKSGEIVDTVSNVEKLITAAGVYAELANYQTNLSFGTGLSLNQAGTELSVDHPFIALAEGSIAVGGSGGQLNELAAGTNGQVLTIVNGVPQYQAPQSTIKKASFTNPALTPSSGICTWTIAHTLNSTEIDIKIYEVSTGEEVIMNTTVTGTTGCTIHFNADSNVAAGTYKAVLIG